MAETLQCVSGAEHLMKGAHIFGVRHLSPASAYHLLGFLERIRPKCVLIEGPGDCGGLLPHIADRRVKPPIAILAYTTELPVRTVLYPLAEYSPEYQAACWAFGNQAEARFIDLPACASIAIAANKEREDEDKDEDEDGGYRSVWDETLWERQFEHCGRPDIFTEKMRNFAGTIPAMQNMRAAYNHVREAYMKRQIEGAFAQYKPEEVVVVTGAYHIRGLTDESLLAMSGEEYKTLPQTAIRTTLMPYSYYRLSLRSGYGAGNNAPAYFQLMWDCLRNENGDGGGELAAVAEAIARADIGTAIGELPEGVSQTPVQDDMSRQLKRLKLERFKSVVAQDISLDLRENRAVKSEAAAYLDLNRSIFFNRLAMLGIGFARPAATGSGGSTWNEKWMLRWSPETEIEVVEAALKGESIETAAAFALKEKFDAADNILGISRLLRKAFACDLLSEVPNGLLRLQTLCVEHENFAEAAHTAEDFRAS